MKKTLGVIFLAIVLCAVAVSQSPPPYLLYVNIGGVATPVTSTLTTGELDTPPPAILTKCMNGGLVVDCSFGGSGSSFITSLTTNGSSGAASVIGGVLNIPVYAGGSTAFSAITSATNTIAAMLCGTGCSLGATGTGAITATAAPLSGLTGLGASVATFLATPSSANLRAALTDESGTGAALFAGGNIGAATGTSLLVTGNIDGTAPLTLTTGTTATLGGTFKSGYTLNQEATAAAGVAYTLPTAAAGLQYCIGNSWNGTAATTGVLTLNASATGQFIIFTDGTLSATGGNVTSGGAAADAACVVGVDATHWQLYTQRGTWTKH